MYFEYEIVKLVQQEMQIVAANQNGFSVVWFQSVICLLLYFYSCIVFMMMVLVYHCDYADIFCTASKRSKSKEFRRKFICRKVR